MIEELIDRIMMIGATEDAIELDADERDLILEGLDLLRADRMVRV